ncbi:MAG: hypothetical protein EBZ75_15335 [Oxalobacteraceae bacterium]|nr:hypothetical protein [Oxalobacteraceae bacterium]
MSNQIQVISPYWLHGTWVFDDDRVGLVEEPFVSGVPEMIFRPVSAQEIVDMRDGVIQQIRHGHSVFPVVGPKFLCAFMVSLRERAQTNRRD